VLSERPWLTLLLPTHVSQECLIQPTLRQIRGIFRLDKETGEALSYCFAELLRNVFEHSESPHGAIIAAGLYPKAQRMKMAIVDLGISVPVHIRRKHGGWLDDERALRAALEPRASGSFDMDRNAGLGLYMTRRLADMVSGKFWLLTGCLCARHDGTASPGGRAEIEVLGVPNPWRGTVVALTLRPGGISSFDLTMRRANEELRGGSFKSDLRFSKSELEGNEIVQVSPDVGKMAQDKVAAAALRREKILPALRAGKTVLLSFGGIAFTTQSFVHALLAEPLRELGPGAALDRLIYARCSDQVREVIRLVVGYVLEAEQMRDESSTG
jgi:anti-sigma regulatory factor (Ser/Thr protein kinase)